MNENYLNNICKKCIESAKSGFYIFFEIDDDSRRIDISHKYIYIFYWNVCKKCIGSAETGFWIFFEIDNDFGRLDISQ